MKKRVFIGLIAAFKMIAVLSAMLLMLSINAFAAPFEDLQNAIDGNGGEVINEETERRGYGGLIAGTGSYAIEALTDGSGGRIVQLNETASCGENTSKNSVIIAAGQNITLDLNGCDIVGCGFGSVIKVYGSLTLRDSSEGAGRITGGHTGVDTDINSSFTMNGGIISDHDGDGIGGGVVARGEFIMNGGEISDNDVTDRGGGVFVSASGRFTMNGGAISNNTAVTGGGVYVNASASPGQRGGVFTLKGGAISGGSADEGGGVFVANSEHGGSCNGSFAMSGGSVDGNTARIGEGGGIYIDGTGEITGGRIINNRTLTRADLGGGGIYIENRGSLTLRNAVIINNTADGLGGGLATCIHGKTIMYITEGVAIYHNTAQGKDSAQTTNPKIDGQALWANEQEFKRSAQDIFAASDGGVLDWNTEVFGRSSIIIGAQMLGDGLANWSGYVLRYNEDNKLDLNEDGTPQWEAVAVNEAGYIVYADRLLGLTSNPATQPVVSGYVEISGNTSATHGGGVANNGILTIGIGPFEENIVDSREVHPELNVRKALVNAAPASGGSRTLRDGEFTFIITAEDGGEFTGTNDADGSVSIQFPANYFNKEGVYTFTLTEKNTGDRTIQYDSAEYQVVVTVTSREETVVIGKVEVSAAVLTAETALYQVSVGENGEKVLRSVDGVTFVNEYIPEKPGPSPSPDPSPVPNPDPGPDPDPGPQPDPDPEPDPEPEPEPDPEPKSDPDPGPTPDPDPEYPTELPDPNDPDSPDEITILEDGVPRTYIKVWNEEEEEFFWIPDDDIPLTYIPLTGDDTQARALSALISAFGLAWLIMDGKRSRTIGK